MESFEFAIKKDVRNNPIVREVDRARHRELWESVIVGAVLVAVVLFWNLQHFELLRHGYKFEQLRKERAAAEEQRRQLRLEFETLRAPSRVEALAVNKLHLVSPDMADAVVIERVLPAEPPARSVVARR